MTAIVKELVALQAKAEKYLGNWEQSLAANERLLNKLELANRALECQADEIEELRSHLARSNDLLTMWLRAHGGDDKDVHVQTVEYLERMQKREEGQ